MYVHAVKAYKFGKTLKNKDTISQYTTLCCNKSNIIIDTKGITQL